MKCICERKEIREPNGDWDCLKNEQDIYKTDTLRLTAGIFTGKFQQGFYIDFYSEESNDEIIWTPKYCPWCGRKLKDEESFRYFDN